MIRPQPSLLRFFDGTPARGDRCLCVQRNDAFNPLVLSYAPRTREGITRNQWLRRREHTRLSKSRGTDGYRPDRRFRQRHRRPSRA